MSIFSTNFSMPNIANSVAGKTTANATSSSSSTPMDASNIGSTFLSLLTQELQNQDPTAPMDSTAMVGQMISLNQLSQLVSINQAITGTSSSSSSQTNGSVAGSSINALANNSALQSASGSAAALAMMFPSSQLATAQPAVSSSQAIRTSF